MFIKILEAKSIIGLGILLIVGAIFYLTLSPATAFAQAPPPPTNLNVVAGISPNININWTPSPGADHYRVYRAYSQITDANKSQALLRHGKVVGTSYIDSTGIPGETYYYQVTAVNPKGEESPVSTGVINDHATVAGKEFPHSGFSGLSNLCRSCHMAHGAPQVKKIFRKAPEIEICYTCHDGTGSDFNIRLIYENQAAHDTYLSGTTGTNIKCMNCHHPHGKPSPPRMTHLLEENLCFLCHKTGGAALDGTPYTAPNIQGVFDLYEPLNNPLSGVYFAHPVKNLSNRHTNIMDENTSGGQGYYNMTATTRHAECVDCHNSHQAQRGITALGSNVASLVLRGVSGVSVLNGQVGTIPSYTFIEAIVYEYELCFKCHSSFNPSWSSALGVRRDKAFQFNVNNPSYHPVEDNGKNLGIKDEAFTPGTPWNPTPLDDPDYGLKADGSLDPNYPGKITCSACHNNSDPLGAQGPHASSNQHILKKPFTYWIDDPLKPVEAQLLIGQNDLCFECHSYNVYYEGTGQANSRFGIHHPNHVKNRGISCFDCHDPHGRADQPHLIRIKEAGESVGVVQYDHYLPGTPNYPNGGGKCWATCHYYGAEDYQAVYDLEPPPPPPVETITAPFDQALWTDTLKTPTDADKNTKDITAQMKDGKLDTGFEIMVSKDKAKIIALRINQEANPISQMKLRIYVSELKVGSANLRIYPYQADGLSVNTSVSQDYQVSSTAWQEIDVTSVAHAMNGFGWMKFRVTSRDNTLKVSEAEAIITQ